MSRAPTTPAGPTSRPGSSDDALDASTVFSEPATQSARFRALTPVGGDPALFSDAEPQDRFRIRLAQGDVQRRGNGVAAKRRGDEPAGSLFGAVRDPFLFSFLAHSEGRLAGSLGVRLDSPRGLAADEIYRDELDELRAADQKLGELVQVSVDMNSVPRRVLAGLFHTAYLFTAAVRGCDYCMLVANARHADFFYSSLGFDYVGDERMNRRTGHPVALLAAHLPKVNEALARLGGRPGLATGDPTLFSHGFSPEEAAGVIARLQSLGSS